MHLHLLHIHFLSSFEYDRTSVGTEGAGEGACLPVQETFHCLCLIRRRHNERIQCGSLLSNARYHRTCLASKKYVVFTFNWSQNGTRTVFPLGIGGKRVAHGPCFLSVLEANVWHTDGVSSCYRCFLLLSERNAGTRMVFRLVIGVKRGHTDGVSSRYRRETWAHGWCFLSLSKGNVWHTDRVRGTHVQYYETT